MTFKKSSDTHWYYWYSMKKPQSVAKFSISMPIDLYRWILKRKQDLDRKNYPSTTSISAIIVAAIREMQDRER